MDNESIILKGIRVNNLKNVDVEIPANQLVVVTGLSGSGKSSLVFDTIYAEGQRRYVESINAYARQFFGKIGKPTIEFVQGIPPAIAIEQKISTRNPRSTVGTITEIYEYIKLLYARLGKTYSPVSGREVKRDSVSDVVDFIINAPQNCKIMILAPLWYDEKRTVTQKLEILKNQGFSRAYCKKETLSINDCLKKKITSKDKISLVVDRCTPSDDAENKTRLSDSVETAYFEGNGNCIIVIINEKGVIKETDFSNHFQADGMTFCKPNVNMFTFTNSYGACPKCNGTGLSLGIDPDLVIPDKTLSAYDGAVACWRGETMSIFKDELLLSAHKFNFPIHKPICDLSQKHYDLLWAGNKHFTGITKFFEWLETQSYKIQFRVLASRFQGQTACPNCKGSRLRPDAEYVKINGKSITELCSLSAEDAFAFFQSLTFSTDSEKKIADFLLKEITVRLQFLLDLGLPYLTIHRLASTLSGGEYQRINLATSLGSALAGALYILDEPSVGLHSIDTHRLIKLLQRLRDIGNTVIVVEHDEDIIRSADYIIDVGPLAGINGGEIIFSGAFKDLKNATNSITAEYINGQKSIPVPQQRRKFKHSIQMNNIYRHNLKRVNVEIPLGVFTVVTGVSGSGKSTLINQVLYAELKRYFDSSEKLRDKNTLICGDLHLLQGVEMVDQKPIGRSSRSNPVTYTGAFNDIRDIFAAQPLSKARLYKPGFFSLNVEGGRCETCQGEGYIKIGMQFMSDVEVLCDECNGKRFKEEVFDVKINGKSIADVLEMSIDEGVDFFKKCSQDKYTENIVKILKAMQSVGLGYLQMGQSSSSLSGGEAQRIKLSSFLSKSTFGQPMLFIFDEPTTGLHVHDISKLYDTFELLLREGHTILVIEHNLELIKCADWLIDLGPESGDKGGQIIFTGTPEDMLKCKKSHTAKFLKEKIQK
jgi:excinuclease ABC subunit A